MFSLPAGTRFSHTDARNAAAKGMALFFKVAKIEHFFPTQVFKPKKTSF